MVRAESGKRKTRGCRAQELARCSSQKNDRQKRLPYRTRNIGGTTYNSWANVTNRRQRLVLHYWRNEQPLWTLEFL
jgi:hypothetical protein